MVRNQWKNLHSLLGLFTLNLQIFLFFNKWCNEAQIFVIIFAFLFSVIKGSITHLWYSLRTYFY